MLAIGQHLHDHRVRLDRSALDELLADEGFDGLNAARAIARVTDTTLDAGRHISVTATSRSELIAVSSNDNTVDAVVDIVFPGANQKADFDKKKTPKGKKVDGYGASGAAGGFIIASNKVNSDAEASITFTKPARGDVTAGGTLTAAYNADVAAFYTKWLRELMESQRPSGAFPGYAPYPFQHGWDFGTAWADAGAGPCGPAAVDAGADAIFGHHSHRLNPLDTYRGRPIAWGLGNWIWTSFLIIGMKFRSAIKRNSAPAVVVQKIASEKTRPRSWTMFRRSWKFTCMCGPNTLVAIARTA